MSRINGYIMYCFVEPGWKHPDGYKFRVVEDSLLIAAVAERQEMLVIRSRDQVRFCKERGHDGVGGCAHERTGEPLCERWLESAISHTRTDVRTMLVRVEIPA